MRFLGLAAIALLPGCAVAGLVGPARFDGRLQGGLGAGGATGTAGFSAGLHLASAVPKRRVPVDVGIGVIRQQAASPEDPKGEGKPVLEGAQYGAYLEVARLLWLRLEQRSWLGVRVEVLDSPQPGGAHRLAATLRASWEFVGALKGGFAEGDGQGVIAAGAIGMVGIGGFAEAGLRTSTDGDSAFIVATGISVRTPLAGFLALIGR